VARRDPRWVHRRHLGRGRAAKTEIVPPPALAVARGEKHLHGATATSGMTHFAITEALEGEIVEWMERVSAEQYVSSIHRRLNVLGSATKDRSLCKALSTRFPGATS
jgi:hypothetical protein